MATAPRSTMVASVTKAVGAMTWVGDEDQAAVDLCLGYARAIDRAETEGTAQDLTKALYLGPHLLNALAALGGTPAGRAALDRKPSTEDETGEGVSPLAQLRNRARAVRSTTGRAS